MDIVHGFEAFRPPPQGVVLTIGNFDGMHRGHVVLISAAADRARPLHVPVVAMTFEPHPIAVLAPERTPPRLTTRTEKLALLEQVGVTACIVQEVTAALLAREAGDFLASLVAHVRPRALVEGPDFRFGHGRRGTIDTLRAHASAWGYDVHIVPAVRCADLPTDPTISSSSIRQALRDGRIGEANAMLGRPYRVVGLTGHGEGRGATLGFPTVNLEQIPQMLPQEAVYAAMAQLDDGTLKLAAVNIGPQPTFDQPALRVEAFILDLEADLRGRRVGLHFLDRLREQQRFSNPDGLIAQLHQDVAATRSHAGELEALRAGGTIDL